MGYAVMLSSPSRAKGHRSHHHASACLVAFKGDSKWEESCPRRSRALHCPPGQAGHRSYSSSTFKRAVSEGLPRRGRPDVPGTVQEESSQDLACVLREGHGGPGGDTDWASISAVGKSCRHLSTL